MIIEDPDTFLLDFDILCQSYVYTSDAQNLKLFPCTLKRATLRWFMGLFSATNQTWGEMIIAFPSKYQDYCWTKALREEIFRMKQKE